MNFACGYDALFPEIWYFSAVKKEKLASLKSHRFFIRITDTKTIIERAATIGIGESGDFVVG